MKSNVRFIKVFLTFIVIPLAGNYIFAQQQLQSNNQGNYFAPGASNQVAVIYSNTHTVGFESIRSGTNQSGIPGQNRLRKTTSSPDTIWTKHYGGTGKSECYSTQQTTDGGYIMVGRSNAYGAGDFDAWLIKTNENGVVSWSKTFGDSYIDEAYSVKQVSDGGYIIAGMSTSFGWAGEGWLIRTDSSGNVTWSKGYHPDSGSSQSSWDYLYDVVETTDGGFVAVGFAPVDPNSLQAWIVKVNGNGEKVWEHLYGGPYWERLFSIQQTTDTGFIVVGDRHISYDQDTTFKHDGWLLKFNNTGDTLWTKHFGGVEHDLFHCVKQTSDGGYIIAGERQITEPTGFQGWLVKTDANGNAQWNKSFSNGGLYGIQQTSDGNFLAAGTIITTQSAYDGWLLKVNQGGEIMWENVLTGSALDDMFLSLNKTSDGGYIMGGKYNSDSDSGDYYLVKLASEGPLPLWYFFQNFDGVTPPALPQDWSGLVDVLLSNTIAEVKSIEQGSTTSLPNATFIMNGLNGSNGQLDTTAFVALITPFVQIGNTGATLTFWATGGNSLEVGKMSDPLNPSTFTLIEEIPLTYDFTKYTFIFLDPCTTYLALKHKNTSGCTPLFVDDAEFMQIMPTGIQSTDPESLKVYPNPASVRVNIEAPSTISSIRVINGLGSVVYSNNSVGNKTISLNTSNLSNGNYLIWVVTNNGKSLLKKVTILK
jgi:hypothetical protein